MSKKQYWVVEDNLGEKFLKAFAPSGEPQWDWDSAYLFKSKESAEIARDLVVRQTEYIKIPHIVVTEVSFDRTKDEVPERMTVWSPMSRPTSGDYIPPYSDFTFTTC